MIIFMISFNLFDLLNAVFVERPLIITTTSGPVKGKLNEFNGIQFYTYKGIPYAENPTRKLRFKPPVPRTPWTDVWDGTKEGAICSQLPKYYRLKDMTEDCLNVNIYVPRNGKHKLLPVMVFIHGGALQFLSGNTDFSYAPPFLLDREIIYASMNYRLGPFGFLSLDIEEASGNAGLKDVLLSLHWIKQNIKKFGGDPNRITIAGHSSGSVIINYLLLTNQSDGLFNQAVLMSGSAFSPKSYAKHSKDNSLALAKELGIETDDVYKTLECLQKVDAEDILLAYNKMSMTHESPLRLYAPFVPSTEVESQDALFIMNPLEDFRKNGVIKQKVPILVSITSQEAIYMIPYVLEKTEGIKKIQDNPEYLIPSNIEYPLGSQKSKNLSKILCEMYFDDDMQNVTLMSLIEFMSDTQNAYSVYFWIDKYKKMGSMDSKNLYFYIFDFMGDLNIQRFYLNSTVDGAAHGDDVPYVFVANITKSIYKSIDKKTKRMMNTMIDIMTNFVYYGNPTPENVKNEFKWPDYGKEQNYLLINQNPVVQKFSSSPIYPRMQFWEQVYNEYYDYVENGGELEKKIIP